MAKTCVISCSVRKGMFPNEVMAEVPIIDRGQNRMAHLFVDKRCFRKVDDVGGKGELRAWLVREDRKSNLVGIVLPQPTLENGPNVVMNRSSVLRAR